MQSAAEQTLNCHDGCENQGQRHALLVRPHAFWKKVLNKQACMCRKNQIKATMSSLPKRAELAVSQKLSSKCLASKVPAGPPAFRKGHISAARGVGLSQSRSACLPQTAAPIWKVFTKQYGKGGGKPEQLRRKCH